MPKMARKCPELPKLQKYYHQVLFWDTCKKEELPLINIPFVLPDILDVNEVQGAFVTKISTQRELRMVRQQIVLYQPETPSTP